MSEPILLTLSAMSPIAVLADSAAFATSPPHELTSDAAKLVAWVMYWFALMPHVLYASAAYPCSLPDAEPKSVSTPPTSCS